MSENDELVENAEELPGVEEPAEDEGAAPETAEVVEETVSEAEAAVELAEAEYEELPEAEEIGVDLEAVEEVAKVDLNTASEEELQTLPGIGQSLAARIVNYRVEVQPFQEPADITAVAGVSEALYVRIADLRTASPVEPAPAVELEPVELAADDIDAADIAAPMEEIDTDVAEAEDVFGLEPEPVEAEVEEAIALEPEPEVEKIGEELPPGAEPPLVEVVQARVGWGRILFIGLLSAILGAILALAFLFAVNGTLDFHTAAVRVVQFEVVRLEDELGALNAKLGDVEGRLQAIQALDSRLTEVETGIEQLADDLEQLADDLEATQDQVASMTETMGALRQEFTNLSEDLDGMADHVSTLGNRMDDMEEQLAGLSQEIETIHQATERFDAFLDGLRELLGSTEGAGQGASPLGPLPEQTPTLRPMVTVIPLATPTPTPMP